MKLCNFNKNLDELVIDFDALIRYNVLNRYKSSDMFYNLMYTKDNVSILHLYENVASPIRQKMSPEEITKNILLDKMEYEKFQIQGEIK